MQKTSVTVSIVSHNQNHLVQNLLADLVHCHEVSKIIVTHNLPESKLDIPPELKDKCEEIFNSFVKGFGANHNQAFKICKTLFYCVMNPDIRLPTSPFTELLKGFDQENVALVAPAIFNSEGALEDNARDFPTPKGLILKSMGISSGRHYFENTDVQVFPDWVGGMFMLFKAESYRALSGFDEEYFLYYEDVDICFRLRKLGLSLNLLPQVHAVHNAQRASHKNLRHLRWHIRSMFRYLRNHFTQL